MLSLYSMRKDKEYAFQLRREGKSYKSISEQLYIPKSTLSGWFSDVSWSNDIKKDLISVARNLHTDRIRDLSRARGQRLKDIYEEARIEARREYEVLKSNPVFISGVMLYWGEGDKSTKNRCSLSNSDPNMLRLFSLFLEKVCGVEKNRIRAWILAYPDIDKIKALEFWSKMTLIWPTNFSKTIVFSGGSKKRTLSMGVCTVMVFSSYLKVKILEWVKLLGEDLVRKY